MIAYLKGSLLSRDSTSCVIDVQGIGYEVQLPAPTLAGLPALGVEVELFTHFHVREDAQQLFGFSNIDDKRLFLLLLQVKGVGPKLGLAILSQISALELLRALKARDVAALSRPSGVGKKLAERLAIELSEKAADWMFATGQDKGPAAQGLPGSGPASTAFEKAIRALQALGYPSQNAKQAVQNAMQSLGPDENKVEEIVKAALKFF